MSQRGAGNQGHAGVRVSLDPGRLAVSHFQNVFRADLGADTVARAQFPSSRPKPLALT